MRALRIALVILFAVTSVVFGVDRIRTRRDRDIIPPVISCENEELHLSVSSTDEDLLRGVRAVDERDGDVTSTIVIAGKSNFIEEGEIRVDYSAFDSHNNVATYSRRVIYDDYHSPRFYSKSPLLMRMSSSYDFDFFGAEDVLSGDISRKVKIVTSSSGSASTGEYPVVLEVTNDYGDVEKLSLILHVCSASEYNRMRPSLSDYIVYIPVGEEIDLRSYLIGIRQGDREMAFEEAEVNAGSITIDDSLVDYSTPGVYSVDFDLRISYDQTTETEMILIVTEDNG